MATHRIHKIHKHHVIKCPKEIDPEYLSPEYFGDFIPPGLLLTQVKGFSVMEEYQPCRFQLSFQFQEGAEANYEDLLKRCTLRDMVDIYKPQNTIILSEEQGYENGTTDWTFEYQVLCKCKGVFRSADESIDLISNKLEVQRIF